MARSRASRPIRPAPELGPEAGPTFGEALAQAGLLARVSQATRDIIRHVNTAQAEHARVHLLVVTCLTCTAPKACCSLLTTAYLHEAVPIAARLVGEGRDTPELRDRLRAAAHAMESARKETYQRRCEFLGADDRCTIYEDRPSVCGNHMVSSPAEACSDPSVSEIQALTGPLAQALQPDLEEQFCLQAGLRRIPVRYKGALPRMVLLALEAWNRRDYITFLADRALPAAHRFEHATR
ncbi:MAG TPA: YkgJ family cysteine cluster protein [Kofleriaceae bacterium]|nr:YkgJ family cysteine cluster protein [Kofleriaceae bacterium]